jgi:hypothetical protein
MSLPRKTNIEIYNQSDPKDVHYDQTALDRRQELLDRITKADTYLPDSVLHDDLDLGMLEFVKENFKVDTDDEENPVIPIIGKILTVQRWGEITNNWMFSDDDGNMKVPFIGVVRKPDVQPGSNPALIRTIPDRKQFHYATVQTWDGVQKGADVYKIPQPVPVDIGFEVTIVCQKFRDLNKFNKIVLQKFASRQAYTSVKGHYVPIILESINDGSPVDSLDSRRYYVQTYNFLMLGFLIDPDEFEVKPAVNRLFLLTEFLETKNYEKKFISSSIDVKVTTFSGDGVQTTFSVGETIGVLFFVAVNGLIQDRDIDYYWIGQTSRITFVEPPNGQVMVVYYAGRSNVFKDAYGNLLFLEVENFTYDGSSLTFTVNNIINSVVYTTINGLVDVNGDAYEIGPQPNQITFNEAPVVGSRISIAYLR